MKKNELVEVINVCENVVDVLTKLKKMASEEDKKHGQEFMNHVSQQEDKSLKVIKENYKYIKTLVDVPPHPKEVENVLFNSTMDLFEAFQKFLITVNKKVVDDNAWRLANTFLLIMSTAENLTIEEILEKKELLKSKFKKFDDSNILFGGVLISVVAGFFLTIIKGERLGFPVATMGVLVTSIISLIRSLYQQVQLNKLNKGKTI